ncbi:hypothetical protein HOI26_02280 [Candidatus Woesearchaeota archaeon]|nr:hypothetical protein [Candidatus Woesearchaeota archaeon]
MGDYYLENRSRLQGQPKKTIGDYVASNGILVPRRFDTLVEARRSHRPIFLRSEHQQEYDGSSGLLKSLQLGEKMFRYGSTAKKTDEFSPRGMQSIEEISDGFFKKLDRNPGTPAYRTYCKLLGIDQEEFQAETTFSLWEKIKGLHRTVVADSAIEGRHHIMTVKYDKPTHVSYTIVEDAKIHENFGENLPEELSQGIKSLIETYEQVRHLSHFDSNHCPIMEFKTWQGKDYFLQYHRTRDFEPATFRLDREPKNGEIEVLFVRGATSPDGMTVDTTVIDHYWHSGGKGNGALPLDEEGAFDIHYRDTFSEIMTRKRRLQINMESGMRWFAINISYWHLLKSQVFKSNISIVDQKFRIISDDEFHKLYEKSCAEGKDQRIPLHVTSDGRRAFVERL